MNDFQSVLGDVTGIFIRGEFIYGGETGGLDNVNLMVSAAPVAAIGTVSIAEDTTATGTLVATDVDSPSLTYSIVTPPSATQGTVAITNPATGAFSFTPAPNFTGQASFTFKANDGNMDSNIATISIIVTAVNDAPVATAGTLNATEDITATGALVATDLDNDRLTYSIVIPPSETQGTVTITNPTTGAYSFTPARNFNGQESFTFKASDGVVDSNIATISITVTAVNDAPEATNGTLTTPHGITATGTLVASDVDNANLTYSIVTAPNVAQGTVAITNAATGAFTFTPAPDFTGQANFTFKANDGASDSNTATISITVAPPVNASPIASNGTLLATEDTPMTGSLAATDADNDKLTYSIVVPPNANQGTVAINNFATGSYSFTPFANFNGPTSFTFKANDGVVDSNIGTISITVMAVNDAPVANNGTLSTAEDTPTSGALMATDVDSDKLTYSIMTAPNTAQGTVAITNLATGTYRFTPAPNFNGPASFTFKANDGILDSNVATVSVIVTSVNDTPVASSGTLNATEDITATGTLVATDLDNDRLTYGIVAPPSATQGTVTITNPTTGAYSFTPALNFNGQASFTFKANDGIVDSNVATISITVTAVNDAPVANNGILTTAEDTPASGMLLAADVDSPSLTFSIVTLPSAAQGTVTLTNPATGEYRFMPALNFNGTASFTFRANDGSLDSNFATISITITPVNDAPVATNGTLSTPRGATATGTLLANDVDNVNLTYSIVTPPSAGQGTVTITNPTMGEFTFTPASSFSGQTSFTFKASDGALDSTVATIAITVTAVNGAPVASAGTLTTAEDTPATGTLMAADSDGDKLTYSLVSGPNANQGTVTLTNSTTGAYSFTPAPNFSGQASFTFKVNDGALDSNVATMSIAVAPVNDAPVASDGAITTTNGNQPTGMLVATDIDSPNLTYSIVSQANAHGTVAIIDSSTGAYSYVPNIAYTGPASFTFKANDGALDSNVATITITRTVSGNVTTTTIADNGPNPSQIAQAVNFSVYVIGILVSNSGQTVQIIDTSNHDAVVATGILNGSATSITVPAETLAVGEHTLVAVYTGDGVNAPSISASVVHIVAGPPKIMSVTPNDNLSGFAGAQRSRVVNLTVVFNQRVDLDANAITLALHTKNVTFDGVAQPTGMGSLPTSLVLNTTDHITWTVTFSGNAEIGNDGYASLKDGVYDLNIDATKVHSISFPAFDMEANSTTTFHRLFGDTGATTTPSGGTPGADFAAVVNTGDNLQLRTAFNNASGYRAYLDFNGDGVINTGDNLQFRTHFNKGLTWTA